MRRANYVFRDQARSTEIEIALPLIQRLSLEAFEAYKSIPRRGLEVGGLLLGSSRTSHGETVISIEDAAEVPSEHRSGPAYTLSPADYETLDRTIADHPGAVGMYRTATQAEKLTLHEDDTALFQRHFNRPGNVFLLIHPASRTAAFCLPSPSGLEIVHEFPFHAADLVTAAEPADAPIPPPAARPSSRTGVWLTRAAAVLAGGVLGALAWRWIAPPPRPIAAAPAVTAASRPPSPPDHVALDVKRDGRVLRLGWDHDAPSVRTADHAILHIIDGKHETNLNLTTGELASGTLSYWAETPDVTFRLEVFGAGHKTDDSIRAVGATAGSVQPPAAAEPPHPAPRWAQTARPDTTSTDAEQDSASRAVPEPPRPSPFIPSPKPDTAPMEAISAPAPRPAAPPVAAPAPARTPEARVEVSAEPVPPSRISRAVGHIPLLRRLKKERQTAVPPQPVGQPTVSLSTAAKRSLTDEIPIDVRVYITESGKVDYAELMDSRASTHHRDLADAAVFAARRWSFRPARLGDEAVPSEAILHFRFRPGE